MYNNAHTNICMYIARLSNQFLTPTFKFNLTKVLKYINLTLQATISNTSTLSNTTCLYSADSEQASK